MWGATNSTSTKKNGRIISIHAPRVGSDLRLAVITQMYYISIHAPRVGSDAKLGTYKVRLPKISIHAPRVGSDTQVH